ncbi:MAG: dTDP-4-dehydrorhamnose 3,5-epimerase family protein [Patescibacteria group bacterium]
MKILDVKSLVIPEIKVVQYQRFGDERGYFTEIYRKNDFESHPNTGFLKNIEFTQINESYAKKGVIKGMHFQWNPYMAKLVRPIAGTMIDLFLDIRKNSPTFGKGAGYKISSNTSDETGEWIWIPVGFAHGLYFEEDSVLEYMCTGQWAPDTERSILPLDENIDWSLMDSNLKLQFDEVRKSNPIMTEKDRDGMTLNQWAESNDSNNFMFSE